MKIIEGWTNKKDHPIKTPYLPTSGFYIQFRGGDVIQPKGKGDWFNPPYFPDGVFRKFLSVPLIPFISVRIGKYGFYIGAKAFGVDSPAYGNWMCDPSEVYDGSNAIMLFSARFSTNIT